MNGLDRRVSRLEQERGSDVIIYMPSGLTSEEEEAAIDAALSRNGYAARPDRLTVLQGWRPDFEPIVIGAA